MPEPTGRYSCAHASQASIGSIIGEAPMAQTAVSIQTHAPGTDHGPTVSVTPDSATPRDHVEATLHPVLDVTSTAGMINTKGPASSTATPSPRGASELDDAGSPAFGPPPGLPNVSCDALTLAPPAPPPTRSSMIASQISVGSVGHPHSCASPCRYVKRKGGCRDGVRCTDCHMCFWKRLPKAEPVVSEGQGATKAVPKAPGSPARDCLVTHRRLSSSAECSATAVSIGTRGHPYCCAPPCKYVRRKTGCRDGAECLKCHECRWQRGLPEKAELQPHAPEVKDDETLLGSSVNMLQKLICLQLSLREMDESNELMSPALCAQSLTKDTLRDHEGHGVLHESYTETPARDSRARGDVCQATSCYPACGDACRAFPQDCKQEWPCDPHPRTEGLDDQA